MTDFEKTTERLAKEFNPVDPSEFRIGRNSLKESVEILARAGERVLAPRDCGCFPCRGQCDCLGELKIYIEGLKETMSVAIAKIKASGNWPLEEKS